MYVDTIAANDEMVKRDSRFTEIQDRLILFNRGALLRLHLLPVLLGRVALVAQRPIVVTLSRERSVGRSVCRSVCLSSAL